MTAIKKISCFSGKKMTCCQQSSTAKVEMTASATSDVTETDTVVIHRPSVHMHLGKGICTVGKRQNRGTQMFDDSFLNVECSASLTEEDLFSLFFVPECVTEPKKSKTEAHSGSTAGNS